ncbi:MAG: hypothetical protein ABIB11_04550, partial [Candidatus Omnitrophota bacterium]
TLATALAEEKMEQMLLQDFSEVNSIPETSFSTPYLDYTYQVSVCYVDPSDFDASISPDVSDYKKVEVQVSHPFLNEAVVLKTLLVDYI